MAIARLRPALVGHRTSGGALLRNTYPVWAPTGVLRHLPVLPIDRGFRAQFVHVEDLADAVARVVERRATGAFNIAGDGEVGRPIGTSPECCDAAYGWAPRRWLFRVARVSRARSARQRATAGGPRDLSALQAER
jgi:nucleoside-diphosphate-sugar epimerase